MTSYVVPSSFNDASRPGGSRTARHARGYDVFEDQLATERGDVAAVAKQLDEALYADFHDVAFASWKERRAEFNEELSDDMPFWHQYEQLISNEHKAYTELLNMSAAGGGDSQGLRATVKYLHSERRAYELISVEYELINYFEPYKNSSLLAQLFCDDIEFRRVYTLWKWCQEGAARDPQGFSDLASEYHSFDNIANIKSGTIRQLVVGNKNVNIDLDSPSTEEDAKAIERLIRVVFALIRCGKPAEAKEIVKSVGTPMLAPIVQMYSFLIDPELSPLDLHDPAYGIGLKRQCFLKTMEQLAGKSHVSSYTRMLWAAVACTLEPLLSMATRTDDRLWCYANAAVNARLTEAIGGVAADVPTTVEAIFQEIVTKEQWPYYMIYDHVLRRDWRGLVSWMHQLSEERRIDDLLARFIAHLVVACRAQVYEHDEESGRFLLKKFIERLRAKRLFKLVPFYATMLSRDDAKTVLLSLMTEIGDENSRVEYLSALEGAGFSRDALARGIVEKDGDDEMESEDAHTRLEKWRWLLLNGDSTVLDTIVEANKQLRHALMSDDYAWARTLLNEGEERSLLEKSDEMAQLLHGQQRIEAGSAVREHEKHRFYFDALEACERYHKELLQGQAYLLSDSMLQAEQNSSFREMDLMQHTQRAVEASRHTRERNRFLATLNIHKQKALETSGTFLQHIGWDLLDDEEADERRVRELTEISDSCYFTIFELLLSSCADAKDAESAIELMTQLVSEEYGIYQKLSKPHLRVLIEKVHNVAGSTLS